MEPTVSQEDILNICKRLGESKAFPRRQIEQLLDHLGLAPVEALVDEAIAIQAGDGILTNDGKRRRSTGGIFFHLARGKVSPDMIDEIFPTPDWKSFKEKAKKRKQAKQAAVTKEEQRVEAKKNITKTSQAQQQETESVSRKALTKLQQLETAADKLRERIKTMEDRQEKGLAMTKRLLKNTEQQIKKLKAQDVA